MSTHSFQGSFEYLEIARGHDGFLRGDPDPVLIAAVYLTDGRTTRMVGRTLHRFRPTSPFPSRVAPDAGPIPSASVQMVGAFRYVVLTVALEEDGGGDVQRLFGAVERHHQLSIWNAERSDVEPYSMGSLPDLVGWYMPVPVELCIDGVAASTSCKSDKWIGAVCWAMRPREVPSCSEYRLPFLAPNQKNDWTAALAVIH